MSNTIIKQAKILATKTGIFPKIQPLLQYQWFYLLGIFTTLAVCHLDIIRTHPSEMVSGEIALYTVSWGGILYLLWYGIKQTPRPQENTPSWFSSWLGLLLLFFVIIRPLHLWHLDLILFRIAPILAGLGLGLLSFGFSGFRQHWRLFLLLCLMLFPFGRIATILEPLLHLSELTATVSAFLLHYIGFPATHYGIFVKLPTGQVSVGYPCTGGPVIISLLRLTLLSVVLALTWWHRWALVISAIVVGFLTGCIRVALLAVIVHNKELFDYWHGATGGGIFTAFATIIYALLCNWLLPLEYLSQNQPDASQIIHPKIHPKRRLFLLGTWLGIIVTAIYLIATQSNISIHNSINLPDKLPLNQWQQTQVTSVRDSESDKNFKTFNYINKTEPIELQIRYILNGKAYDDKPFIEATNPKLDLNKLQKIYSPVVGYFTLYDDGNKAYLTSCINPRGSGTIDFAQFMQNRYKYDFSSDRILPWLFGQNVLRDDRCLWTQLSVPLNKASASDIYPVLESLWLENYTKWQSFFIGKKII